MNYLYGTFLVLRGLEAMGIWNHEPAMQQAAEWIRMVQNADGGWGETCGTYDDPNAAKAIGPSTPSQTAWAVLGLLAAGDTRSDSVAKGSSLAGDRTSSEDGKLGRGLLSRVEMVRATYTGTGFPSVFLSWIPSLSGQYFPLLALTTYEKCNEEREAA